jgi:hypothetical protein
MLISIYFVYAIVLFFDALLKTKNPLISIQAVFAAFIQFIGYGYNFLNTTIKLSLNNRPANELFPKLFFK